MLALLSHLRELVYFPVRLCKKCYFLLLVKKVSALQPEEKHSEGAISFPYRVEAFSERIWNAEKTNKQTEDLSPL